MKITIVGVISHIGEPKQAGTSEVRDVVLHKKYHDPDSGELKGEDYYPIQIWTDKWSDFEKVYHVSSKMEIKGFINGRRIEKDGKVSHYLNITGREFRTV